MKATIVSSTAQRFDGATYYLCGSYYQRKGKRLHRAVWEYHNGSIPAGYHVHHKDGDKSHNDIENLELKASHDHLKDHMSEPARIEKSRNDIKTARVAASRWHGSEPGKQFHSKLGKENWEKRESVAYVCTECGEVFETKHLYKDGSPRFCSDKCRASHRRKSGVDNEARICKVCGSSFVVNKYSKQKTCSMACHRKRRWGK